MLVDDSIGLTGLVNVYKAVSGAQFKQNHLEDALIPTAKQSDLHSWDLGRTLLYCYQ